jgi:bacterioferritin
VSQITDLLQQAVNAETTFRNLYWARSVYWRSMGLKRLARYYEEQSLEKHAQMSADRMAYLGVQPSVNPVEVPAISGSLQEQFQVDLEGEQGLSDKYQEWIDLAAEAQDWQTEDILREIQRQTQEHCDWLRKQLLQVEQMGEGVYLQTWVKKHHR